MKKAIVIGSGFSGMSAASFMARAGWEVTVLEKHGTPGGRARQLKEAGFTFDMGPSWYWMPDVFERYFSCFGRKVEDYYSLQRINPSYRVFWMEGECDVPADYDELKKLFENMEKGSGSRLDLFLNEAAYKYKVGIQKLVQKPGRSLLEFMDPGLVKGILRLDVFSSMKKHVAKYFRDPRLQQLMEFPVLFLGALAKDMPALYSLMNYADIRGGTWYPQGGMYKIAEGMHKLAVELGVKFLFEHDVKEIRLEGKRATGVVAAAKGAPSKQEAGNTALLQFFEADAVIGSADYHFIEQQLLPLRARTYSEKYWNRRVMAPSCLLYYVGVNKRLSGLLHHSLFFDTAFEDHGREIYSDPQWPADPLFYVCATSVTDPTVAPPGCENLFFLVPVAAGLEGDTAELRERYFEKIMNRFEKRTGHAIRDSIIYNRSYSVSDFKSDYNSFKGNAYGLANILRQTAVLKPALRSRKVKNLFYTGQLTVPGPGVPPSLISGEVVARETVKYFGN